MKQSEPINHLGELSEPIKQLRETVDVTASTTPLDDQIIEYRNKLLDCIFDNHASYYAALLVDYPQENLFCGQIGETQQVKLDETEKDCYFVNFIDFENNEAGINMCLIKKKHLLPLFSFDPAESKEIEIKTPFQTRKGNRLTTINEVRNEWEESGVHKISTERLKPHNKSENPFKVGQLVTIEVDFKQEYKTNKNETKNFIIQASQTGIISKTQNLNSDSVEVAFF